METRPGGVVQTIAVLAGRIGRVIRGWATVSTLSAAWLWVITAHSATGTWFSFTPELVILLLVLEVPSAALWFFYAAVRSLTGLPEEVRRLLSEGRLRTAELTGALRTPQVPTPRSARAWTILRSVLELRGLLFRSKSLLMAAGMAVRLRFFNPLSLGALFLALLASLGITLAAIVGTIFAPFV